MQYCRVFREIQRVKRGIKLENGRNGLIEKMTKKLNYNDIQNILNFAYGDTYYRTTFNRNFVVTTAVYEFFTKCGAFWFGDLVNSYIFKIYDEMMEFDDTFFIVKLNVHEDQGTEDVYIQREIYDSKTETVHYHNVVMQHIPFVDLPKGEYNFYLIGQLTGKNDCMFIMMSPSEY